MLAKVLHTNRKTTKEGREYFQNALLVKGRFGDELVVATSNKDYTALVGTDTPISCFWYRDRYCIEEERKENKNDGN